MVKVRAHHVLEFVGARSRRRKPLEKWHVKHVPEGPPRLDLAVAAAGVDENFLAADLQQPAMHAELDESRLRIEMARGEPLAVLGENGVRAFGKNVGNAVVGQ